MDLPEKFKKKKKRAEVYNIFEGIA